jgi:hypothetical protein
LEGTSTGWMNCSEPMTMGNDKCNL